MSEGVKDFCRIEFKLKWIHGCLSAQGGRSHLTYGGRAPVNSKASCIIISITSGFTLGLCFSCFVEATTLELSRFRGA